MFVETPKLGYTLRISNEQCKNALWQNACLQAILTEGIFIGRSLRPRKTEGFSRCTLRNVSALCPNERKDEKYMRIGMGYDVHKLVENRDLILGGVRIPYEKGLLGHSDADVLLHAIMDALLGAAALGDIGKHFPDTDPQYKGISSMTLLEKVGSLLEEHSFLIENIDATIIAQQPKMRPYIDEMRANIASALGIEIEQVNVKATTEEGLGFTGTGEGISSQAICMLTTPVSLMDMQVDITQSAAPNCEGCGGCPRQNSQQDES